MSDDLKSIWKKTTSQLQENISEHWWSHIVEKYNEKGRNSHNYHYLVEKFKQLDNFIHCIKNINSFTIAIFFQYLEYDPKDSECHEKNLQSFCKFADEAEINRESDLFKEVRTLLEASAVHSTEEHKTEGAYGDSDLHYFLDLDMCILGSPPEKYAQYVSDIHREYSFLEPKTFKNLRKKVLQSFLLIPNIFATKEFRDRYDAQARRNIQEELNDLSKS